MVFKVCCRLHQYHLCRRRTCGNTLQLWLARCCLLLGICNIVICGYIEIVEQQACHDNEFRLTCPSLDTHVAILEAVFTAANASTNSSDAIDDTDSSACGVKLFKYSYPHTSSHKYNGTRRIVALDKDDERNLRAPFTHRCSGVNHCSFILNTDHKESRSWGPGVVYIKYACMDDSRLTKFCNEEVAVGEGFVHTPGYPHFYVGEETCRWLLRAPRGQRVQISLLDLSLRSIGPYDGDDCVDSLSIQDGTSGQSLLSSCEQIEEPFVMDSQGETLDVLVRTQSKKAYPKRGILFSYKALGCVTPAAPHDGYLVYRDSASAQFMCCVGYAFPDTRGRERTLRCLRDNTWDNILPDCSKQSVNIFAGNGTRVVDNSWDFAPKSDQSHRMLIDVIIPSILIAALFIGNAVIVLIIFKYRKRKDQELDEIEELSNITREVTYKNGRTSLEIDDNTANSV